MLSKQFFAVRSFPSVVQSADIASLRSNKIETQVRDFVGGYLGFDERAAYALTTSLQAIINTQRGGAFFLNGVYGSGKSHLLGLLALLCDDIGREYFFETHPHFAALGPSFPAYFVTHFSLDEYSASYFSLEEIVRGEIEKEWRRRFAEELIWPHSGTRGEYFLALEEQLQARGCNAIFLGIDELSLFLSAKEHRALQADAAFLQFLGQRAARSTLCPLRCFAALQKTVEDIGDLEAYSLSQIRDRFQTLPLSLAHLPSLIERRLIIQTDTAALQSYCRESYDKLHRALPRLDFGRKEWQQLYPFHPATIALLESVVVRFFSRTRSAALFCTQAAQEYLQTENDTAARVLPNKLFDYLAPELESHPELRTLHGVWQNWQELTEELAADTQDVSALLRLMKTLLLFKIAGSACTVSQIANAISLDVNLGGERNYEYAQVLLERLRTRGGFLAVERQTGDWQNRYTIDLGTRVSELARRHIKSALEELEPRDSRIQDYVLSACQNEPLPLAAIGAGRTFSVWWRNAPREIGVELWTRDASLDALKNRAAALSQPGAREDLLILIAPAFSEIPDVTLLENLPLEARWRNAVLLWTPRAPTDDERQLAREATAAHGLEDDPQLLDNRRGRAILSHLKDTAAVRATEMAELAARLLREGHVQSAAGLSLSATELSSETSARIEPWINSLEAIAEFALPHVFARFEEIAPRSRVLTPSNADTLCLEILRRPASEPYFSPARERLIRAVAEPLGIARADKGRWKIGSPRADLSSEIIDQAIEESTLARIEAHFTHSDWGLKCEQFAVAVCALLRSGEIAALDSRGQVIAASQIGLPLQRAIHTIRPGRLLDEKPWTQLKALVEFLTDSKIGARSFAEQENLRALLSRWQTEARAQTELAQARWNQLRRVLNSAPAPWPQTESTLSSMTQWLESYSPASKSNQLELSIETLAAMADENLGNVQARITNWRNLLEQLEKRQAGLLSAFSLLTHPDLRTPPALDELRREILLQLQSGESVLSDEALLQKAAQWRQEYSREYQNWHGAQHSAARWNSLRQILQSDELCALHRLNTLQSRDFSAAPMLQQEIVSELEKQCARDGQLLPAEATCNSCRLRWGERVLLKSPADMETRLAAEQHNFARMLSEPAVRDYLARHDIARELQNRECGEALLPLLNHEVMSLLERAFQPRRRVARSLKVLADNLKCAATRGEAETAFLQWLEGDERPSKDDEIEWTA